MEVELEPSALHGEDVEPAITTNGSILQAGRRPPSEGEDISTWRRTFLRCLTLFDLSKVGRYQKKSKHISRQDIGNIIYAGKRIYFDTLSPSVTPMKLEELTSNLREQEKDLNEARAVFAKKLQVSFLNSGDVLEINVKELGKVAPVVSSVIETISDIAHQKNWTSSDGNFEVRRLIYDVLFDLQSMEVLGDPTRNFYHQLFTYPVVFLLHSICNIVYAPLNAVMLILVLIGAINQWIVSSIGFTSTALAAFQVGKSSTATIGFPLEDNIATVSSCLAIMTGVLLLCRGVSIGKDDFYQRPEEITMHILRKIFGIEYPKHAVFQPVLDWKNSFSKFDLTLMAKKADIRIVQDVRMFLTLLTCTGLVRGEVYTHFCDILKNLTRIERLLLDPYNYITLKDLEENIYPYIAMNEIEKENVINNVYNFYRNILSVKVFCEFLEYLNNKPDTSTRSGLSGRVPFNSNNFKYNLFSEEDVEELKSSGEDVEELKSSEEDVEERKSSEYGEIQSSSDDCESHESSTDILVPGGNQK